MTRFKVRIDEENPRHTRMTLFASSGKKGSKKTFAKIGSLCFTSEEAEAFTRALKTGCKWNGDLDYEQDKKEEF